MSPEQGQYLNKKPASEDINQAETSPQQIIKKTPLMLKVEKQLALPDESIADFLERLYVQENKSLNAISREISANADFTVSSWTLGRWMAWLHPEIPIINVKEWQQNPQNEEYRISRLRAAWQDPERKKQIVAKIHTPESDTKRSKKIKDYWNKHPQEKESFARGDQETQRRRAAERMIATLGPNPKRTLRRMLNIEGLTRGEIAQRCGLSTGTIDSWIKELHVKAKRRRIGLSTKEIAERRSKIRKAIKAGLFALLTDRQQLVLRALYPDRHRAPTQVDVAKRLDVTKEAVRTTHDRGLANIQKLLQRVPESPKIRNRPGRPSLIDKMGENAKEILTNLYWTQSLPLKAVAAQLESSDETVGLAMDKLGIPKRKGRSQGPKRTE